MPRAHGRVVLRVRAAELGRTRLADLLQVGCGRARFPRVAGTGPFEGVLINTAGGLTGGDRLTVEAEAGPLARLSLTSQAAEKIYRSAAGDAIVETLLCARPGALLEWLPQETILFDGARLTRRLAVAVEGDARFLGVEAVLCGRAAMGEIVRCGLLDDLWQLRCDGRLLRHDHLRLSGDLAAELARPAIGDGATALATILAVAPCRSLEPALGGLRDLAHALPIRAGLSWRPPVLCLRLLAPSGKALRHGLVALLTALRATLHDGHVTLPRVWAI